MKSEKQKILIVDDEPKIVEAVAAYLENSGYAVLTAYDGKEAMQVFEKNKPDLLVLDLMLPFMSGEDVCREIRKTSRIPIIMLTAKMEEDDKIYAFQIGADDYVTKPFSPRELVARINSLLRRTKEVNAPVFDVISFKNNDLEVDIKSYTVKKAGNIVNLTPNEFKLLCAMITYPQKTFTREELIEIAFGHSYDGFERTIDSHIKNLRSKIEDDTTNPEYIVTVRGIGYKFGGNL